MTTHEMAIAEGAVPGWAARFCDYCELTKPRIGAMVLVTVGVAAFLASRGHMDAWRLSNALVGAALLAASTGAFNQWLERNSDRLMLRTRCRPLPAGRLSEREVLLFGFLTLLFGLVWLKVFVNGWATAWGVMTWLSYVAVYTPLKKITWLNTVVGAVSGALPVLIGWSSVDGRIDIRGLSMFLMLFLWQFPHFMAIAWIYREQYHKAGFKMLTVVDPSGARAGVQAVLSALAIIPVSFVPGFFAPPPVGAFYVAFAFVLGVGQLACAFVFLAVRSDTSARMLLRASLIYLPLLWLLLLFTPLT